MGIGRIGGGGPVIGLAAQPGRPAGDHNGTEAGAETDGGAVQFAREDTGAHRVYRAEIARAAAAMPGRLRDVRNRVASGAYEPDVRTVAERLLAAFIARDEV